MYIQIPYGIQILLTVDGNKCDTENTLKRLVFNITTYSKNGSNQYL